MPEIIPNSPEYLKISDHAFQGKEEYLVYFKTEGSPRLVILGLREWLKKHHIRQKQGFRESCGKLCKYPRF